MSKRDGWRVGLVLLALVLGTMGHWFQLPAYVFLPIWALCAVGLIATVFVRTGAKESEQTAEAKSEKWRVLFMVLVLTLMTVDRYFSLPLYITLPILLLCAVGLPVVIFKKD